MSGSALRRMVNAASDGLLVTGSDGRVLECNDSFLAIGRLPEGWRSRGTAEFWAGFSSLLAAPAAFLRLLHEAASAEAPEHVETLLFTDGREVEARRQVCALDDGAVGWLWRFREMAALPRAEAEVVQEREWLRVTLSSIGDAVITTDTEARVTFLNPVAETLTGWTNAEARGKPLTAVFRIVNELTRVEAVNPVARVLAEGTVIGLANHTALIDRNGKETAIEDSAAPIRDATGAIVGTVMVFHDVDARRKAEQALQRSERLLADFFANAPIGLNWIGPEGCILKANRSELNLLGYLESDYIGRRWEDFHEDPATAGGILKILMAGGAVENCAARLRARDGSVREVLISANAFTENGRFVHARCFTRDVTGHNRAEAARAHLAALVASSDDAIISKNLQGVIQSWNAGAQRIFGYSAEEVIGKSILLLIPPERHDEETGILERLRRGERVEHFETVRRRKDGTFIDVSITVSPILNANGDIIGASKIAREITERIHAERALREEHAITEQLNLVAQTLGTNLDVERIVQVITDAGTRITHAQFGAFFYNRPAENGEARTLYALSGVDRSKFEKFPMPRSTSLFGPTFRGEGVIRIDDVRKDPRFGRNPPYNGMPEGHLPVVSYLAVPVFARSGEVLGGLFFGHSEPGIFTERDEKIIVAVAAQAAAAMETARLYEAERKARAAAEMASETKDRFIATMSHELRTPLTPVLAILSGLRDNPALPSSVVADLDMARRNVLLEARLIDDLLDLTRISRGKLNLHEEVVHVEGLIEAAVNTCLPDLELRRLNLVQDLRAATAAVRGDSARLIQVFWNLLKNAIKFTPDGGTITIRSRTQSGRGGTDEVVVEFEDTGIGIESEELPRIFAAFEQGRADTNRRFGGLGLGLAISRAIVEAHQGGIDAASPGRNRGSTFTLSLPLAGRGSEPADPGAAAGKSPERADRSARGRRILLVEDHADTAAILKRILTSWGHSVLHATTLENASRLAEQESRAQGLDLVISDLGLPDGSGLDLMRDLSARYSLSGIALSGYGMESDQANSAAAGFKRHLTKPVDLKLLRDAVDAVVADRRAM